MYVCVFDKLGFFLLVKMVGGGILGIPQDCFIEIKPADGPVHHQAHHLTGHRVILHLGFFRWFCV